MSMRNEGLRVSSMLRLRLALCGEPYHGLININYISSIQKETLADRLILSASRMLGIIVLKGRHLPLSLKMQPAADASNIGSSW